MTGATVFPPLSPVTPEYLVTTTVHSSSGQTSVVHLENAASTTILWPFHAVASDALVTPLAVPSSMGRTLQQQAKAQLEPFIRSNLLLRIEEGEVSGEGIRLSAYMNRENWNAVNRGIIIDAVLEFQHTYDTVILLDLQRERPDASRG